MFSVPPKLTFWITELEIQPLENVPLDLSHHFAVGQHLDFDVFSIRITIFEDRSFTFITKTPPTSFLLRKAAGLDKASENPGREMSGSVSLAQITEIAETKLPDLNTDDIEQAKLQIAGTARSMGIEVR